MWKGKPHLRCERYAANLHHQPPISAANGRRKAEGGKPAPKQPQQTPVWGARPCKQRPCWAQTFLPLVSAVPFPVCKPCSAFAGVAERRLCRCGSICGRKRGPVPAQSRGGSTAAGRASACGGSCVMPRTLSRGGETKKREGNRVTTGCCPTWTGLSVRNFMEWEGWNGGYKYNCVCWYGWMMAGTCVWFCFSSLVLRLSSIHTHINHV